MASAVPDHNTQQQSVDQKFEALKSSFQDIGVATCSESVQVLKSRINALNEGIDQYGISNLIDYRAEWDQEMVKIGKVIASVQKIRVGVLELKTDISKNLSAISIEVIRAICKLDEALGKAVEKTTETARVNLSILSAYLGQIDQLLSDYSRLEGHTFKKLIDNIEAVQNGTPPNSLVARALRYVAPKPYRPGMFQPSPEDRSSDI